MIKISSALREIIEKNPTLKWGIHYKLLNLSRLARFLKNFIDIQTGKTVTKNAILMNLSRLQNQNISKNKPEFQDYKVNNLTVNTDLIIVTFHKTPETHRKINNFYNKIIKEKRFFNMTESSEEITVIFDEKKKLEFQKLLSVKPKQIHEHTCAIGIKFAEKYLNEVGFIHHLVQQLSFQHINILEISSTYTELIFYLAQKDLKLAFNTFLTQLSPQK